MEHILVIDDIRRDRDALAGYFTVRNYRVTTAQNLAEAELALQNIEKIDTCLLDIKMNENDRDDHSGLLMIPKIRRRHPDAYVVVSSYVAAHYEKLARLLGADEVITKLTDLTATAKDIDIQILNRRSAADPARRWLRALFVLNQVGAPLAVAAVTASALRAARFELAFIAPDALLRLPFELAVLYISTASCAAGKRDPTIHSWAPWVRFRQFRIWLLGTIAGGIMFELFKEPAVSFLKHLLGR